MVRNKGKLYVVGERKETNGKFVDDVDELFRLPLAEFTAARNTLAAGLKKSGRGDEADLVKVLIKPSITAWTVNQLYWNHREAFDRLIESGVRFHKAQTSRSAGKLADMRAALEARREALTQLSDLATSLLRDAGHNPTPDTLHRITTTLEAMSAMSAYASRDDAPRPGRLTHDVDPPGFESLASLVPGTSKTEPSERPAPSQKPSSAATNTRRKVATDLDVQAAGKAKIAAARVSLQDAKKSLTEARAIAQNLEATQKKAYSEAKKAENHRRDAEESLQKAKAASDDAARRARGVAVEVEEAARAVKYAERTVGKASEELEKLFRESAAR
jgi:hypothetical protein